MTPLDLLKRPLAYFEHLVIPLLMSMTRTAQELTIASLTKSAGNSGAKTSYITYCFGRFALFYLDILIRPILELFPWRCQMIRVSNLIFRYTSLPEPSLRISDLSIPEGECLVLCGKSGSGKTSFTRLLNCLIQEYFEGEYSGDINVFGLVPGEGSIETFSKLTSTVFQNPASQFFYRKTEQELAFPCENQGLPPQSICERLNETSIFPPSKSDGSRFIIGLWGRTAASCLG